LIIFSNNPSLSFSGIYKEAISCFNIALEIDYNLSELLPYLEKAQEILKKSANSRKL